LDLTDSVFNVRHACGRLRAGVVWLRSMKNGCGSLCVHGAHLGPLSWALIVHTKMGERLKRGTDAVVRENDPSPHGEVGTVRLACKKLKSTSLAGYTMYSTCEPGAGMANALGQSGILVTVSAP
jgi:tRNA(Arg) A34 adenosine deaminase TadA